MFSYPATPSPIGRKKWLSLPRNSIAYGRESEKIAHGGSDFITVRERGLYYVDKTEYLARMEDVARFIFFIRPRRFGKSLFISMMRTYYDKALAGRFDEIFGGLYVGSHPTEWRNRFQVLYFDFSRVDGDLGDLESQFSDYCCSQLDAFMDRYAAAPRVLSMSAGTKLHKIIMQFEGWTLRRIDEVAD